MAHRTNKDITLDGKYAGLTVPKGTRVKPQPDYPTKTRALYWVDEFQWIEDQTGFKNSMQKHDAVHYGITIEAADIEEFGVLTTMIIGTSYFVSKRAAVKYYSEYEPDPERAVERKLAEGQIHIGKPELKSGETLRVIDNGTRYAIES